MPVTITREEVAFIREVERLSEQGLNNTEAAEQLGVAPGTITYRLNRFSLARQNRIVDRRTGKTLDELLECGEFQLAEEPAPAEAREPAAA